MVPTLSLGAPNQGLKVLFLVIYFLGVVTLYWKPTQKVQLRKTLLGILSFLEIGIICIFVITMGSLGNYIAHIKNFFVYEQSNNDIEQINLSNIEMYNDYFNEINTQLKEINQNINLINQDMTQRLSPINNEIMELSENFKSYSFIQNNQNEDEVNIIYERIENYANTSDSFSELKTNKYQIELFYKMFFSNESYYYGNILTAFERYGINYRNWGISQFTLITWDLDILFITYKMKEENKKDLDSGTNIERVFLYNDYRFSMNEYSDTFDYNGWMRIRNDTVESFDHMLDLIIKELYKKFKMNFSE